MGKIYLYIRGQAKEAQRAKLKAEFPQGELVIDRKPPEALERLITEAGQGDLIAAVNVYDMPGISAETYKALCCNGSGFHFQQQPHLDSSVFNGSLSGEATEAATASTILQRQLDIEAERQAQQRAKETTGRTIAKAAGRNGGRRPGEKQITKKEIYMKDRIRVYLNQGLNSKQILEALNDDSKSEMKISKNTFYKYLREINTEE